MLTPNAPLTHKRFLGGVVRCSHTIPKHEPLYLSAFNICIKIISAVSGLPGCAYSRRISVLNEPESAPRRPPAQKVSSRRIFLSARMTISYNWLLDYLPQPIPLDELCTILTSIGLEVEGTEEMASVKGGLAGLLIGEVLTVSQHPGADRLKLTEVSIGNGTALRIVCGAPNVAVGQKVVVAPVGSVVHPTGKESFPIKSAVIRGEKSEGMLCAGGEIGLNDDHAGILVLPEDALVGRPAAEHFGILPADHAIHIGLTPNRTDAMSHLGVARDVCAYLTHHRGEQFDVRLPSVLLSKPVAGTSTIRIDVEGQDACPVYTGLQLQALTVKPSPDWLQQRLRTIGVRPINNVVDATNYVLHEWGQPLHAFDAAKISGDRILVKFLPNATPFTTLDGAERKLRGTDLMICDERGGLCIAGVFGGMGSGVGESTTSVFLESAVFDASTVRRTSMHHGLRTDAAVRFEKGVGEEGVVPALQRAAALILELAGGQLASPVQEIRREKSKPVRIPVSYEYISRLSGKAYEPAAVRALLMSLRLGVEEVDGDSIIVTIPSGRPHMDTPADIVEEVLRIDGLDAVPTPTRASYTPSAPRLTDRGLREKVADVLTGAGFSEILTNSIVNSRQYTDVQHLVTMRNSLSQDLDAMRPRLLESGLAVVAHNVARRQENLLLYEVGNVYRSGNEAGKYYQAARLGLWVTGIVGVASWNSPAQTADLYFLKGAVQALATRCGIKSLKEEEAEGVIVWKLGRAELGRGFVVSKRVAATFDIDVPVYAAELDWDAWVAASRTSSITARELPKAPEVQRDLALVLDAGVRFADVEAATAGSKISALQSARLFDVFQSEKLGAGKKSYAIRYTFSGGDRTLTDAEVEGWMQSLIAAYRTSLNAEIRSA